MPVVGVGRDWRAGCTCFALNEHHEAPGMRDRYRHVYCFCRGVVWVVRVLLQHTEEWRWQEGAQRRSVCDIPQEAHVVCLIVCDVGFVM